MQSTIGCESSKALPVCLNLYIFHSALNCQLSTIEVNTGSCALFQCNYEITILQSILINYAFITLAMEKHLVLAFTWMTKKVWDNVNTLRMGSFKLFKRPFPGFLTILTL